MLLPTVAFMTSLEAFLEVCRFYSMIPSSREAEFNRSIAIAVCCIEAPCMLLMGLGSLLGLYGPYAIPVQIANMVFGAMQGAGILTTFLLGLHLAEECRMMKGVGLERRPIFVKNRKVIAAMGVLALGPDILTIILSGLCYYLVHRLKTVTVFMMILYTVLQGIAGCIFISYSVTVKQPMLEYLRNVRVVGTINSQSRRKIGHLVFWLSASAVIMVLASIAMMISSTYMIRGISDWGESIWPFGVFYVIFARVLVAAAQVHAVRPVDATTLFSRIFTALFSRPIGCLLKVNASSVCTRQTAVTPQASDSAAHGHNIEIRTMPSKWNRVGVAPGPRSNV